jgi:hypothetical protein
MMDKIEQLLERGANTDGTSLTAEQCRAIQVTIAGLVDALQEIGHLTPYAHQDMMEQTTMAHRARHAVYAYEQAVGHMAGYQKR